MAFHWGYGEKNGPHVWAEHWEVAKHPKYGQSPIDIERAKASVVDEWPAFDLKFAAKKCKTLNNNGHSFQVNVDGPADAADYSMKGGPVKHQYTLAQFHFHWGKTSAEGSEHTVDGTKYAAESHLVHYNMDVYKGAGDAIDQPGGLCVLGTLYKVGKENAAIKKLLEYFDKIPFKGDSTPLPDGFDPGMLLPADRSKFWHYYGSLTTPPLHESVNWVVFQDVLEVSEEQLAAFRKLHSYAKDGKAEEGDEYGGCIERNFRPALSKDFETVDKETGKPKRVERQLYSTAK